MVAPDGCHSHHSAVARVATQGHQVEPLDGWRRFYGVGSNPMGGIPSHEAECPILWRGAGRVRRKMSAASLRCGE
eukprot:gene14340-biopygen13434